MESLPAIVIISGVFLVILILARAGAPLWLAIVAGALSLNPLAGGSLQQTIAGSVSWLFGIQLWLLLAVTASVVALGRHMGSEKNAGAILSAANKLGGRHGRLWSLAAAPAVMGLIAMPAGALFSAPMVRQTVPEESWSPAWRAAVNYWFRHLWEYWWPIYPGVIVAMAVFKLETWRYLLALIAFTPATFAVGYWFLLRPHKAALAQFDGAERSKERGILSTLLPLIMLVACALLLPPVLAPLVPRLDAQAHKLLAMLFGMGLALAFIARLDGTKGVAQLLSSMISNDTLKILLTVAGIMLFQYMLDESHLLRRAGNELLDSGIPLLLVIALLPLLAGMITGLAVGFTGIAFPLVVGLMGLEGSALPMATLVLAYGAGYAGMMLSPVHLCLLTTSDYFCASLPELYRLIAPCMIAMGVFTLILFYAFKSLGW